jgi:alpha-L-fucosidase 2
MNHYKASKNNSRRDFVKKAALTGLGTAILPDFLLSSGLSSGDNAQAGDGFNNKTDSSLIQTDNPMPPVVKFKAAFNSPPQLVPTRKVVDGPIMGNGDVGVVLSGPPEKQRFWISKNDFWKAKPVYPNAGPRPVGGIEIDIPALEGGSYEVNQVLENGTLTGRFTTSIGVIDRQGDAPPFTKAGTTIMIRSWVDAFSNFLFIELSVEGEPGGGDLMSRVFPGETTAAGVDARLWVKTGDESETSGGNLADGYWVKRRFTTPEASISIEQKPLAWNSEAAIAMRLLNHRQLPLPWSRGDGWSGDRFIIAPGHPVTIVVAVVTSEESDNPLRTATDQVSKIQLTDISDLRTRHENWWHSFWSKSSVEIGDPLIEKFWYGSHYIMACCSRNKKFPPNLFGNWTTTDIPSWEADYHLNYNHEAPWWAVYSSNHIELSEPYDIPILDYLQIAKENARKYLKVRGVYYDVGIGPKGLETTFMPDGYSIPGEGNRMFLGQKSNAVFATANMFMRFYSTYDPDYAELVYPFLSEVADFWEDYLIFEGNRYIITGDAIGEVGDGGSDKNNCLSLGFVKMFFKGMLDVSIELDRDSERRKKWKHILEHLSDFPVVKVDGTLRIRGAEAGPGANRIGPKRGDTRIEFQGLVWPSGVTGLGSDPEFLKILQDDVKEWPEKEWIHHFNGFNTTFPAAVRVGHDPQDILTRLRKELNTSGLPNLWVFGGGGGIENCCGVPATINEMLLQSHEGLLRLFPVWPGNQDARFENLRAYGAFLVSSSLKNGKVEYIRIISEKGRRCTIKNPWIDKHVHITRENGKKETVTGIKFTIKTEIGEKIILSA